MIRSSPSVYVLGRLRSLPRRADGPRAFRFFFRTLRGSISPAAADAIAGAIQNQEGYYPGSVAWQNNNPGNLVYVGQAGAVPGVGGFAKFSSYAAGYQALVNQINLDATRGTDVNGNPINDLSDLITSWAPPSENNTAAYLSSVSQQTGFDPSAPLASLSPQAGAPPDPSLIFSTDGTAPADSVDSSMSSFLTSGDLSASGVPSWAWVAAAVAGLFILPRL